MARAERLKATVVNVVSNGEYHRLKSLLDQIGSLQPSVEMLHQTGLGFLVADKSCWALGGAVPLAKSIKITASWKAAIHKAKKSSTAAFGAASRPFGQFHKASDFCKTMEVMRAELIDAVPLKFEEHVYHRAAVDTVLQGFSALGSLVTVTPGDVEVITRDPAAKALILAAVGVAEEVNKRKKRKLARALIGPHMPALALVGQTSDLKILDLPPAANPDLLPLACLPSFDRLPGASSSSSRPSAVGEQQPLSSIATSLTSSSAIELAQGVKALDVDAMHDRVNTIMSDWATDSKPTPAKLIAGMAAAQSAGVPVEEVLLAKAATLRLESKRKSLAPVAAALRCWHAFASGVLNYNEDTTLPPRTGSHIEMFISVFRNPATAQNYVGAVKWACNHLRLPVDWYTQTVVDTLKGARTRHTRLEGGAKHAAAYLTENQIHRIVAVADELKLVDFSLFVLISWEFLLRCQSEAIPLMSGSASDAVGLPLDRHSGVWIDDQNQLCLKLQRRKNRPQGSLLRRPCTCGKVLSKVCVVCRVRAKLRTHVTSARLWEFTAASALKQLRRVLVLLAADNAASYTLKAFRAGKATALAVSGKSLGAILAAGEWRSSAFLSYVDTDTVDHAQILNQTLEASEDEQA